MQIFKGTDIHPETAAINKIIVGCLFLNIKGLPILIN